MRLKQLSTVNLMQLYLGSLRNRAVKQLEAYKTLLKQLRTLGILECSTLSVIDEYRLEDECSSGVHVLALSAEEVHLTLTDYGDRRIYTGILRVEVPLGNLQWVFSEYEGAISGQWKRRELSQPVRMSGEPPKTRRKPGPVNSDLVKAVLSEEATIYRLLSLKKK